ncbi:MAG: YhdH/YhfP family quinone oxidoreductase [Devosia sp.]
MRAYRIHKDGAMGRGTIVEMDRAELDEGTVLVRTHFAGVNYKDALASLGGAPIVRRYPANGGIECVGIVDASEDARFAAGDNVICHGRGLGVSHDGGFADYLRVPADWLLALPYGLSLWEAATLGVAGYSAGLAVDRLEALGLKPGALPAVVSGATGGVGSFSIAMLAKLGHTVTAISSKADAAAYLNGLGANTVIGPDSLPAKPMEKARWCGGIDAAGGAILAGMLAATDKDGAIAAIGNAAGIELPTTVLPFILRGVTLTGINADSEMDTRKRIWDRLASDLKPDGLAAFATAATLDDLPEILARMLAGTTRARTVIAFDGNAGT